MKTIVLDGRKGPLWIIETTEGTIRPFAEVDQQFAYEAGEDDSEVTIEKEIAGRETTGYSF